MLLRLHGEIKEVVGGGRQLLSLVFGLFSLHASLSDATSIRRSKDQAWRGRLPPAMPSYWAFLKKAGLGDFHFCTVN